MHRLAERHTARAPLVVLALVIALGAAMCVRVHRAVTRPAAAATAEPGGAVVPAAAQPRGAPR